MKKPLSFVCVLFLVLAASGGQSAPPAKYVGDAGCKDCHNSLYDSFLTMSPKKAHPSEGFPKLLPDFSAEKRTFCYTCHVTGAGADGGFVSYDKTPELGHVGCETCHGAGSAHAQDGNPESIVRQPGEAGCKKCHDGQRVPLTKVYGRPHGLNK